MKLSRIINASGKMTILGGSAVSDSVSKALQYGAENLFLMEELVEVSGAHISKLYDLESASIVASASAGIAQSVAAAICRDDKGKILDLYNVNNAKREIILPKGHVVDYGTTIATPISMGGGKLVEVGYANACSIEHVEAAINDNTAALLYVKSHHAVQKGMPDIKDYIELAKKHNLAIIIDAAAEGDIKYYHDLGADLVIFSGTKTFEGPTSGLVVGRKEYIEYLRLQSLGIGRVMKVGKESILGLVSALETFNVLENESLEEQERRMAPLHQGFKGIIETKTIADGAGRPILRCELKFTSPQQAQKVVKAIKEGPVKIYTRDYRSNEGYIELDIRDLDHEEMKEIVERIKGVL